MTCSSCNGRCRAPQACHQPETTAREQRRVKHPITVDGPYSRPGWIRRAIRAIASFLNR